VSASSPAPGHGVDGQENWRGVATEDSDELSAGAGIFLRDRSRRLLGELLAPHRRSLWGLLSTVTVQNLAWLAGPFLIGVGIDVAVPALVVAHRPSTVLLADRVALLQDGRITAVGRHSELLAEVPAYRELLAQDSELAEVLA
jgi:hypothetical protein